MLWARPLSYVANLVLPAAFTCAPLLLSGCKILSGNPPSGESSPIVDGETDVTKAPPEMRDDLAKVPTSLWSPAQRRSTATTYYLVGEYAALKEKDPKKSLQSFQAAYNLDPNPFLGGKMLAARAAAGERAEAMLDARKMVLLYPRDAQLRFFYGDMLVQAGQIQDASEQLEKCVELDPQYESAYLELADVYQTAKQSAKALVVTKELVKNLPSSIAGWSQLSRIYLLSNQYKEALLPARRAYDMQSTNPQLTQIYAVTLQLNGKTKQAARIYEQLYRLDPSDEELMSRMIDLYRQLGDPKRAIDLLDEMAKQGGQAKPAIQMQKAVLLWELKRNDEASALLDKLVKDYPDSDKVRYLAAFGAERMDQPEKAMALYQGIVADSPLRREADLRLIVLLKDKKKFAEAMALGEKLIADPNINNWEVYGVVSGVYADAEKYSDAIRIVSDGLQKFTGKSRLLFLKGVYQEKAGDRDGCITTMREVIKVDPENSSAFNYLGYLFAERGEQLDEAEKLIGRALQLKPNDGFYLDSLGWVHFQKGEYDKALPLLEQAKKLEPKEGVIFEHLADVKKAKGDAKAAQALYQEALGTTLEKADRERIEKKAKDGA